MNVSIKNALILVLSITMFVTVINAQTCNPVGTSNTYYDPTCAQGGLGCNAGGQTNCRFCGFDVYPACPTSTGVTSSPTGAPQQCPILNEFEPAFYDPTCAQGGLGCGAGGNSLCRFCGFSVFPPCPTTTVSTTRTTTTTTTTTTPTTTAGTGTTQSTTTGTGTTFTRPPTTTAGLSGDLLFSDDFDTFDTKKWKHDLTLSGGGNWEFQVYINNRTNSFVKNGELTIKPTLLEEMIGAANIRNGFTMNLWGGSKADECTGNNWYGCERTSGAGGNVLNPIQSAKITTQESFSFRYGKVEVRAKLPQGDWLWPAIWLLPRRNSYGQWPASGEIDIMESRGNVNYPAASGGGVESFGSTLHWGPSWTANRYILTHVDYHHSAKLSDEFHTYGLYWSEDRLYTYFDDPSNIILDVDMRTQSFWEKGAFPNYFDNPWYGLKNAPFDQEFYLIINLAVGGTAGYFPDGVGGKPYSDMSSSSANQFYDAKAQWWPTWTKPFVIDSVKVWRI